MWIARTSSIQTFDSLDFARYSDDGDQKESDKVAGQLIPRISQSAQIINLVWNWF